VSAFDLALRRLLSGAFVVVDELGLTVCQALQALQVSQALVRLLLLFLEANDRLRGWFACFVHSRVWCQDSLYFDLFFIQ
jgi:hypothetical protein